MAEPILNKSMEKAQFESYLSITSNDIKINLNKEFLEDLQKNTYHGWIDEDVIDHIAKVLEIVDLIRVPGTDSHQLRMKIFPLSLTDEARQWWIDEGEGKIAVWEELVEKFFCKFYPDSYDGEDEITKKVLFHAWMNGNWNKRQIDNSILSSNNTTSDSFFIPNLKTHEKSDTGKEEEQSQTKRKYSNTSSTTDEQPNKRRCKAEKFEAIQYSLGPNEEYIAIRSYEYDIWERNEDNLSIIYQDIFKKKDEGWKISGLLEYKLPLSSSLEDIPRIEHLHDKEHIIQEKINNQALCAKCVPHLAIVRRTYLQVKDSQHYINSASTPHNSLCASHFPSDMKHL
ncbi:hypothetical protein Tco_0666456 [Tanacetum coccineum]